MPGVAAQQLRVRGFERSWNGEIVTGRSQTGESEHIPAKVIQIQTAPFLTHDARQEYRAPLRTISGLGLKLVGRKPVSVHVSRGETLWFAENHRLDIYASGESAQEAINEFKLHLLRFFLHYRDLNPAEAMSEALRLKAIFEETFVEADL